ncbi:hypothetical protein CMQ_5393 [Grosmannia clavigera kw1407]|uniref:Cytochrome c oxidase assembly protein COX20, mitochondrial n=1 Tax=Grosmannia clavigera (strain kw1407 / UAMH 11150) TaxID=655863 RepID=F0XG11_GROCL|nr:uncharacterized protein CMQ_5393 [Grosmannia clavigera kw1407]EFX03343.1 hypothetical protein CMQ_5393 [Grosmannia clavigera kw1407]
MGREESISQPPPPAAPMTTGATATWGSQHFDRAPTAQELRALQNTGASGTQTQTTPKAPSEQNQQEQIAISVSEAVKTIKPADFLQVYQYPCARQGFMTGIGGGAVVGMLRYILGANIPKATNWAVGMFALGGIVSFEVCQAFRRAERAKMQRVVEVYDRKQAELRHREEEKKRRQQKEQREREEREAAERAKQWWKVW